MDSEVTKKNESMMYNKSALRTYLFLFQGICLAAVGVVGLLENTSPDVDSVRLKNRNVLILLFAFFHVIAGLICCIDCKNKKTNLRLFIAYVLWGCVISGLVSFQTLRLYEYEQTFAWHVIYTFIMTGILNVLVVIVCCLHLVELCKPKSKEKSVKLLLD